MHFLHITCTVQGLLLGVRIRVSQPSPRITCRNTCHQHTAWWACELNTSLCRGTSPPYSLQRQEMKIGQCDRTRLTRSCRTRDSLWGKVAAGATALTGKERTEWDREHIKPATREMGVMQHNESRFGVWLWGGLPGCGSCSAAVSAVEQKPHEGSVSQHKNKHAGTQT